MLKVYGTEDCPDCRDCKKNFDKYNIEYEFLNIKELKNLKQFLIYRDSYPEVFDRLKKVHDIGIPCIVDNDNVFCDWETYLKNKGYSVIQTSNESCSIFNKNC